MAVIPEIYVSAVESELKAARIAVAESLRQLGYHAVWHDYSAGDPADCRPLLARKIRHCNAVVQLVGAAYGLEPSATQQTGGRTSYAQYEALCAREVNQPVWHFILQDAFADRTPVEQTADAEQLQLTYRRRVETFASFSRPVNSLDQLRTEIGDLKEDLFRIRSRTVLRQIKAFVNRLGFHRFGLNGHPAEETSRAQS